MTAMESPHVDRIGHMTARKLNRRDGADIALDKVFAKAVETGTFVEINSQLDRLDLRDTHARAAAEAGVRLVVNTDSHEVDALAYAELGIAQGAAGVATKATRSSTRAPGSRSRSSRNEVPGSHLRSLADAGPVAGGRREADVRRARGALRNRPGPVPHALAPRPPRPRNRPDGAAPADARRGAWLRERHRSGGDSPRDWTLEHLVPRPDAVPTLEEPVGAVTCSG